MTNISRYTLLFITSIGVLLWLAYTSFGLWSGYSYWNDELWSVAVPTQSIAQQFHILINDVHPPLYQIALAIWIAVFGESELATRGLSALFVASIAVPLYRLAPKLKRTAGLLFVVFFLSNWLVYFYAQEARSYAMLLSLTVWSYYLFLDENRWSIFLFLSALALTHFYGALVAVIMLFWIAIESRTNWRVLTACGATFLVAITWPIMFLTLGQGNDVVGGDFWIRTSSAGSLRHAIQAGLPLYDTLLRTIGRSFSGDVLGIVLNGLYLLIFFLIFRGFRAFDFEGKKIVLKTCYLLFACVLSVYVISFHTPTSMVRNFIILAAPGSLLAAVIIFAVCEFKYMRHITLLAVAYGFCIAQFQINEKLASRFAPEQDWKGVAREVLALAQDNDLEDIYLVGAASPGRSEDFLIARGGFYLRDIETLHLLHAGEFADMPIGSVLYFGHTGGATKTGACENNLTQQLTSAGLEYDVIFAEQFKQCQNGYIIVTGNQAK